MSHKALISDGRYVAVTFIEAPLESVVRTIVTKLHRGQTRATQVEVLEESLPQQLYNPPSTVVTLWKPATAPSATMLYSNLEEGSDSLVYQLGILEGLSIVCVRASSDHVDGSIRELIRYEAGEVRRMVRVMRDDPRWTFYEEGARLPFEDGDSYATRLIKKRLSLPLLLDYCEALGWPIREGKTWQSEGWGYRIDC